MLPPHHFVPLKWIKRQPRTRSRVCRRIVHGAETKRPPRRDCSASCCGLKPAFCRRLPGRNSPAVPFLLHSPFVHTAGFRPSQTARFGPASKRSIRLLPAIGHRRVLNRPPKPPTRQSRRMSLAPAGIDSLAQELSRFKDNRRSSACSIGSTMLADRASAIVAERLARAFVGVQDGAVSDLSPNGGSCSWLADECTVNRP